MERKIEKFLKKWKDDSMKKPLILFGSKQIGKTFSVLDFGKKEYKNMIYFNTDNNKEIINLFTKEKSTEKLILNLSLISGETILKEDTLVICSDGLTNMVSKEEILNLVTSNFEIAPKELVDLANQNGGIDNITVITVKNL